MDLADLRALRALIKTQSLQGASRELGVPRSTLRRQVLRLEEEIGVALIDRGIGAATPTAAAYALAEKSGPALAAIDDAILLAKEAASSEDARPIRIIAPVGVEPWVQATFSSAFLSTFSRRVELTVVNDPRAHLSGDWDVMVFFGASVPNGPWSTVRLDTLPEGLFASPEYLEERGTPGSLDELREHTLMSWAPPDERADVWPVRGHAPIEVELEVASNDIVLLHLVASTRGGIVRVPHRDLPPPAVSPPLVPVLRALFERECAVTALVPQRAAGGSTEREILRTLRTITQASIPDTAEG